jgi:5'-3' exonuclease
MTALIDGDFLLYRSCYGSKDFIQTIDTAEFYFYDILDKVGTNEYRLFLTTGRNFRYDITSSYKSNRKVEKPRFFYELRDYLFGELGAETSDTLEADDLVGINQTESTIIVGEDKDLTMIPGHHYRIKRKWNENCFIYISPEEAIRNFWFQTLTGDAGDSIKTLKGIGPKKAEKILADKTPEEMKEAVIQTYQDYYKDDWFEHYDRTCRLIWIRRHPEKEYHEYI